MWWRRSDGQLVRGLSYTRRVMPYLMRGRNEAVVYFEQDLSLHKTDTFIREWNQANPNLRIDVFQMVVWGLKDGMTRNRGVNRFVAGGRLYERRDIWFSYAVKQKLENDSPMVVVKRRFDEDTTFGELVQGMAETQAAFKTGDAEPRRRRARAADEVPELVRRVIMAAIRGLDRWGMLPPSYIHNDPMYSSAFFAHMASLGMPAVYHHLYEYGTAGIFCSSVARSPTRPVRRAVPTAAARCSCARRSTSAPTTA